MTRQRMDHDLHASTCWRRIDPRRLCVASGVRTTHVAHKPAARRYGNRLPPRRPQMVRVALLARLEAKPGKESAVEELLKSALPLANAETATTVWFALRLGPTTFGIF